MASIRQAWLDVLVVVIGIPVYCVQGLVWLAREFHHWIEGTSIDPWQEPEPDPCIFGNPDCVNESCRDCARIW